MPSFSPADTLSDIYAQLSDIKLWICDPSNYSSEKEKILSLPFLNYWLDFEQSLELERHSEIAAGFTGALNFLLGYPRQFPPSENRSFLLKFNFLSQSLNSFTGIEFPACSVFSLLNSFLFKTFSLLSELPPRLELIHSYGSELGNRELELVKPSGYLRIEIEEFPAWLGKDFFYFQSVPQKSNKIFKTGMSCFFWSDSYGYLSDRIPLLQTPKLLEIPRFSDRLLLSGLPNVRVDVSHYDYGGEL